MAVTGASSTPRWLAQAAEEHPSLSDGRYREDEPAEVRLGDVCVVAPLDPSESAGRRLGTASHLFVVVKEAEGEGWFTGIMASAETELATEVDAVLAPECSGLGYEIVVHSRYFGPIWTVQVRRRIGAVDEAVLAQLDELSFRDEPTDVNLRLGLPLQPEGIDPRYPALRALSVELDSLTDHCRRRRHDLGAPVLDPAVGTSPVLEVLLAETGWKERIVPARPSTDLRDQLLDAFPSLTKDQQHAAMPLLESALRARLGVRASSISEVSLDGHSDPVALARAVSEADESIPVTRVLSHRKCWRGGTRQTQNIYQRSANRIIVVLPSSDILLREVA